VTALLAYIPFLEPIEFFHDWWYLLLIPLSFGISVIYKAMRMRTLDRYWRHVAIMTTQIVAAMIALSILLIVLVQVIIPIIPVQR
jgi:hypothetical protein